MTISEIYGVSREDILSADLPPMTKLNLLTVIDMTPEDAKKWRDASFEAVERLAKTFKKHLHKESAV